MTVTPWATDAACVAEEGGASGARRLRLSLRRRRRRCMTHRSMPRVCPLLLHSKLLPYHLHSCVTCGLPFPKLLWILTRWGCTLLLLLLLCNVCHRHCRCYHCMLLLLLLLLPYLLLLLMLLLLHHFTAVCVTAVARPAAAAVRPPGAARPAAAAARLAAAAAAARHRATPTRRLGASSKHAAHATTSTNLPPKTTPSRKS